MGRVGWCGGLGIRVMKEINERPQDNVQELMLEVKCLREFHTTIPRRHLP